jgi:hypothetical protein
MCCTGTHRGPAVFPANLHGIYAIALDAVLDDIVSKNQTAKAEIPDVATGAVFSRRISTEASSYDRQDFSTVERPSPLKYSGRSSAEM